MARRKSTRGGARVAWPDEREGERERKGGTVSLGRGGSSPKALNPRGRVVLGSPVLMALGFGCGRERERERDKRLDSRAALHPPHKHPVVVGYVIKRRGDQSGFRRGPRGLRPLDCLRTPSASFSRRGLHIFGSRTTSSSEDSVRGVLLRRTPRWPCRAWERAKRAPTHRRCVGHPPRGQRGGGWPPVDTQSASDCGRQRRLPARDVETGGSASSASCQSRGKQT